MKNTYTNEFSRSAALAGALNRPGIEIIRYGLVGSFEQLVGKNDRTSRQMRSCFSGVFACHKLQEFATGCVIRHMMSQLSFILETPKREQRATFVVGVVQDQLSWR